MKTNTLSYRIRKIVLACLLAGVVNFSANSADHLTLPFPATPEQSDNKEEHSKKKRIKKLLSGKKNAVSISMDENTSSIRVKARKKDKKQVDFFVFDMEGTLVHNYRMKANDEKKITGLQKGTYIYRVFCGDEETAAGKIEVN